MLRFLLKRLIPGATINIGRHRYLINLILENQTQVSFDVDI